jgi:protein-S-isoprenylcysteine O-methyltransferase Ste14
MDLDLQAVAGDNLTWRGTSGKLASAEGMSMAVFESWLHRWFHVSVRGLVEFVVVAAVFICAVPTPQSLLCGAVVSALGLVLRVWSSGYVRKAEQIVGPFRWLRHPHLLGSLLLFLGLCLAGRNAPVTAVFLVAMAILHDRVYLRAEAAAAAQIGPAYTLYRGAVPALLPRLWPYALAATGLQPRFAWRQALLRGRQRELGAGVGLILAWVALYGLTLVPPLRQTHVVVALVALVSVVARFVYYASVRRKPR